MADNPFHKWLENLRGGDATVEWADQMAEVVQAVRNTGKAGSLTITLEVKPGGRTVKITDRLKSKLPTFDREQTIWFVDDEGQLFRHDPTQVRAEPDDKNDLHLVTPPPLDNKSRAAGAGKE